MPPADNTKPIVVTTPTVPPADLGEAKGQPKADTTKKAETPKTVTKAATAPKPPEESTGFNLGSAKGWAIELGMGYGWRNAQNGNGLDHSGWNLYTSVGPQGRFGRHTLTPKLYLSSLGMKNDLGFGFVSEARATGFGVGANYHYNLGKGIGIGANLDLGIVHYSAPEGSGDGSTGFGFGGNALLLPVANNGIQLRVGPRISFFDESINVYLNQVVDSGVNPEVAVVDGGNQRHPGNFAGPEFFVTANPIGLYNYFKGNRRSSGSESGTIKHVGDKPTDKKPVKTDKKPAGDKPKVKKKPDPAADFKELTADFNGYINVVKQARVTTDKYHTEIKAEGAKRRNAVAETMLFYATDSRKVGHGAHKALKDAEKTLNLMKEKSIHLTGDAKMDAFGKLNEAKKDLDQAKQDYFYAYRSTWLILKREYPKYRKRYNKGIDDIKFDLEKPEWTPKRKARRSNPKPKTDPKPKNKKPPKADLDSKKPPKKDPVKSKGSDNKKPTDFD